MSPLRALARPLLAATFVLNGVDALRRTDEHVEAARPVLPLLEKAHGAVPAIPEDPRTATRLLGAVQIGAGVLLATGKAPRLAAATLALTLVPTALGEHPVWAVKGEERRKHAAGLLQKAALLGGLLFAAEDRQGKPSLGWRIENRRQHRTELDDLRDELAIKAKEARLAARSAKVKVRETAADARAAL